MLPSYKYTNTERLKGNHGRVCMYHHHPSINCPEGMHAQVQVQTRPKRPKHSVIQSLGNLVIHRFILQGNALLLRHRVRNLSLCVAGDRTHTRVTSQPRFTMDANPGTR